MYEFQNSEIFCPFLQAFKEANPFGGKYGFD